MIFAWRKEIYLYDMLKLIGFHWPIKRALNEEDFVF